MFDGVVTFRSADLDTIQSSTTGQQQKYQEIWEEVRAQLRGLIDQGLVDASLGEVIDERDREFRQQSDCYDQGVTSQNQAVRNVQQCGIEGGALMRQRASGR
ncbi:hypothetical protein [Streptomyces carpaticus]|uniref:Uncharacterized protein n=1 Tax=Streptomyces carpaticus TaxID=285558 RepID=A0ABV4ZH47_9ACTN